MVPLKYIGTSAYRDKIAKTETRLSLVRTCMMQSFGNSCQDSSPSSNSDILGKFLAPKVGIKMDLVEIYVQMYRLLSMPLYFYKGRRDGGDDEKDERKTVCYSFCKSDGCNAAGTNLPGLLQNVGLITFFAYNNLCKKLSYYI